jgi:lipopolysaccharide export system permease protein
MLVFMMFFIGAPLGAIIRKGGLGLPIIFAVLIFISFHFINTFGRK